MKKLNKKILSVARFSCPWDHLANGRHSLPVFSEGPSNYEQFLGILSYPCVLSVFVEYSHSFLKEILLFALHRGGNGTFDSSCNLYKVTEAIGRAPEN